MVRIYAPRGLRDGLARRGVTAQTRDGLAQGDGCSAMNLSRSARRRMAAAQERRQRRWAALIPQSYAKADARRRRTRGARRSYGHIWSPMLRRLFLQGLAATGNVRAAARILGVNNSTFYIHRQRDPGLAILWRRALSQHLDDLIDLLIDRAKHGWDEEVWHQGKFTGMRHRIDNKLLLDVVRFLALREKEQAAREHAAAVLAAAASAKVEQWGGEGIRRGRLAPPLTYDDDEWAGEEPLRPRHSLFLDLMNRHRNRHPEEWDGDRHPESGFDFADWRNWLEEYARRKRAEGGEGDDGEGDGDGTA